MAANHRHSQPPSVFGATPLWTAVGLFSLVLGSILLVFDGAVFSSVEWLVELSLTGPNTLSAEAADMVRDGIDTWAWAGLVVAAIALPVGSKAVRSKLVRALRPVAGASVDDALPSDRHGPSFFLALLAAMEEISWGQRLIGWGTPAALEEINFQGETTIHNVNFADNVIFEALFWGSVFGLAGGVWRFTANQQGLSDRMRLVLPSLMISPALLLILVWRSGDLWQTANIPRLIMDHFNSGPRGSEVPEALLGLCIVIYTFNNLKQARYLNRLSRNSGAAVTTIGRRPPFSRALAKERR